MPGPEVYGGLPPGDAKPDLRLAADASVFGASSSLDDRGRIGPDGLGHFDVLAHRQPTLAAFDQSGIAIGSGFG